MLRINSLRKFIFLISCLFMLPTVLYSQMRTAEQEPFIPGNLIVQIDENVDLEKLLATLPSQYEFRVNQLLASHMRAWLVEFNPFEITQMNALNMVNRLNGITLAQNNHVIEMRSTTPNDPQFNQQWHHLNTGQSGGTVDADTDIDEAWSITTGGQNALGHDIVVCILEGVDFSHNDLIQNRWTNPFEIPGNGVDDDGNGYVDDINGWNVGNNNGTLTGVSTSHGTNVAGMIGAKGDNNLGVVGANWDVKMMNVVGYSMTEASVVSAYNYPLTLRKRYNETNGTEGAFIVSTNASWGIDNANPNNYPIWCQFYDTLGKYGILNCGATTNTTQNVDVTGDMPTACPSTYMLGIGRSGRNDNIAGGYGLTTIDFPAPGIDVRTTSNGNNYTTTTGTSFASPLTAGVIALLYSIPCPNFMNIVMQDPEQAAFMVYEALMNGVDPKPNMATTYVAGGRLNAKNAMDILMEAVCSSCVPPTTVNISNITENSATFNYEQNEDALNYSLFVREVGETDWTEFTTTIFSINATGLQPCTEYEYYMTIECIDETSTPSPIGTFNTVGCGNCIDLTYCSTGTTDPGLAVAIHTPSSIATTFANYTLTDNWGGALDNGYQYGDLVLVQDATANPEEGCQNLINGASVNGNIAVVVRGTCNFSTKALNAQNAGATAVFMINNQTAAPASLGAGADAGSVTIPVIMISQANGAGLLAELTGGGSATGLMGVQNEWIESFEIDGNIVTSGDDGGYRAPDLSPIGAFDIGGSYDFEITPGFDGQDLLTTSRIWIDLNQNGTFETNELVYDQGSADFGVHAASLTIPSNALSGSTRMRVQMAYQGYPFNALPDVCGEFVSGEIEDYCIELLQTEFCNMTVANTISQPSCLEIQNGSISVTVSGGTPGYTYSWNNGAGNVNMLSDLSAGNYVLTITDDSGCDTTITYNLSYAVNLAVTGTVNHPTCAPNTNGSIVANATGSTGITYQWLNGPNTATNSNLAPGFYTVTATDINGCTASNSFNLLYSANLSLSGNVTHPTCDDSNDGSISVNATGGTGLSYQWTDGPSNSVYSGIGNGSYTITVTAANGCSIQDTYTLLATPENVTAQFGFSADFLDMTFVNTSSNGNSYSWDFGDGNSIQTTNPIHTYANPGTYTVCLTAIGDCDSDVICQEITVQQNTASLESNGELVGKLYPNPTTEMVVFETNVTSIERIEIVTIAGQQVLSSSFTNGEKTLDVSGLAEGIYIFNARSSDDKISFTQKLVIRK